MSAAMGSRSTLRRFLFGAALLACILPAAAASGDAEAGRKKSTPCAACHGANGVSPSPAFPNLAGQYPDYLEAALRHYKSGRRKNPIMAGQVANLSTKDMMDLAAYFSSQKALQVKH
jgi:cytochrome c553